jgi:hypothetical protein
MGNTSNGGRAYALRLGTLASAPQFAGAWQPGESFAGLLTMGLTG